MLSCPASCGMQQHGHMDVTLVSWQQVIITTWQPELPSFSDLEQRRSGLWQRPAWARGVLVDSKSSHDGPPLHTKLQHVSLLAEPSLSHVHRCPLTTRVRAAQCT